MTIPSEISITIKSAASRPNTSNIGQNSLADNHFTKFSSFKPIARNSRLLSPATQGTALTESSHSQSSSNPFTRIVEAIPKAPLIGNREASETDSDDESTVSGGYDSLSDSDDESTITDISESASEASSSDSSVSDSSQTSVSSISSNSSADASLLLNAQERWHASTGNNRTEGSNQVNSDQAPKVPSGRVSAVGNNINADLTEADTLDSNLTGFSRTFE